MGHYKERFILQIYVKDFCRDWHPPKMLLISIWETAINVIWKWIDEYTLHRDIPSFSCFVWVVLQPPSCHIPPFNYIFKDVDCSLSVLTNHQQEAGVFSKFIK